MKKTIAAVIFATGMFGAAQSNVAQQTNQVRPASAFRRRVTAMTKGGGQPCLLEAAPKRTAAPPPASVKLEKPPVHKRPVRK